MIVELELLDEQVFTKVIQYVLENEPMLDLDKENFSLQQKDPSPATLPFIYLHQIVATETSRNLEADCINGGLFTYEIRVTSNVSQSEAKKIANAVGKAFKSMGFWATSLPLENDYNNLHVRISRWQRQIDEGDTI